MTDDETQAPKVFISYSHDSTEHQDRVLELSNRLINEGIHCNIDQYVPFPPEGWPFWMQQQIEEADFVLMICTPTYYQRVMRREQTGKGLGVLWEATIIYNCLYDAGVSNDKFIPILFPECSISDIPPPIKGASHFRPTTEAGYEALYRLLTKQPLTPRPKTGQLRILPPRNSTADLSFSSPIPDLRNQQDSLNRSSGDTLSSSGQTAVLEKEVKPPEQTRPRKKPLVSPADDHSPKKDAIQQSNSVQVMDGLFDHILTAQSSAREAIKLFNRQRVFFDECNRALSALETIRKPAQELDRLVERHPSLFGLKRFELLKVLHRIEDQVDKFVIVKGASCPSCPELPVEQRQDIQEQLKEFQLSGAFAK